MFKHYLKIALRNLRKYALQNTVSILGLASGFLCLSLSTLWFYFENSFDTCHKDSDRIFAFSTYVDDGREVHNTSIDYYNFPTLLEYPELESYTKYGYVKHENENATEIKVDSSFFNFFDLPIISGNRNFLKDSSFVAITKAFADRMFPGEDPIGKECFGKTVSAVIKDFGRNSAIQFDALSWYPFVFVTDKNFSNSSYFNHAPKVLIKVKKGIDIKSFDDKVKSTLSTLTKSVQIQLLPIKEVHRKVAEKDMYVNYSHMNIFLISSILLMICAIFNFMLFSVNRLIKRQREMALRMVNGATVKSIVLMLTTEIGIILGAAMLLGLLLVQIIKPHFIKMADVQMTEGFVTIGSLITVIIVFVLSLLVCILSVRTVRKNTKQQSISRSKSDNFRKISIGIQTFIGVLFIFSVSVMLHQLNFLRNNDWGTKVNDIAVISIPNPKNNFYSDDYIGTFFVYYPPENDEETNTPELGSQLSEFSVDYYKRLDNQFGLSEKLRSIPEVNSVYIDIGDIESVIRGANSLWKSEINGRDSMSVWAMDIAEPKKLGLLKPTVIDGEIPDRPLQKDEIIITENMQKEFGLGSIDEEPTITVETPYNMPKIGYFDENKIFHMVSGGEKAISSYTYRVVAVIKDIYPYKFDAKVPMYIICSPGNRRIMPSFYGGWGKAMITLEYEHGMKEEVKEQISKIMDDTGLEHKIEFTEDRFFSSLQSQEHLKNLILVLGLICIFVAVFGIWSMITLTCQERRREIAVRKIHGARIRDILIIFAKEYGKILTISSVVAFCVGFIIMHQWQQQYARQATISWWIYAVILVGMAAVICLTVVQRVLKAARENPAEVIKSE
jgi:ABC-type antimicrobial peptide transport system permease subunit